MNIERSIFRHLRPGRPHRIIPIEVKSGLSVKAKSLKTFREKFKSELSIRISLQNLRFDDGLLNLPLYLLSELPRFLREIKSSKI